MLHTRTGTPPVATLPQRSTTSAWADNPTPMETHMTWETPTACDLRFGFEITMYIAAR